MLRKATDCVHDGPDNVTGPMLLIMSPSCGVESRERASACSVSDASHLGAVRAQVGLVAIGRNGASAPRHAGAAQPPCARAAHTELCQSTEGSGASSQSAVTTNGCLQAARE